MANKKIKKNLCVLMKQKMIPVALYNQVSVSSKTIMQRVLLLMN